MLGIENVVELSRAPKRRNVYFDKPSTESDPLHPRGHFRSPIDVDYYLLPIRNLVRNFRKQ